MPTYDVPGVYIDEVTSPGVIAGVGTSTAAFIGPAVNGPTNTAYRITSYEDFLAQYAITQNGKLSPYIASQKRFYMANAVQGFFQNGGQQAYIVRIGTGSAATHNVHNQAGEVVFTIKAKEEGTAGSNVSVEVQAANATGAAGMAVAMGHATVQAINATNVTVSDATPLQVGDCVVTDKSGTESTRAFITNIQGNVLTLSVPIPALAVGDTLRIANIIPDSNTTTIRMVADPAKKYQGLNPGSVVSIQGDDADNPGTVTDYAMIANVDRAAGFVTLSPSPARTKKFSLSTHAPVLISQECRLMVTPPGTGASTETYDNLSLVPVHPNYVFATVNSDLVSIEPPKTPPVTSTYPGSLAKPDAAKLSGGNNDNPSALTQTEYKNGLDVLKDIDDVNILCIPDAAANPEYIAIQKDMIDHCTSKKDRFAILDSRLGAPPLNNGSVLEQRKDVTADDGFAALYYPWLIVSDPDKPSGANVSQPLTIPIPPSGHIAGVYARTDSERGIHKAPANTDVRGVLGLEQRLSNAQQGPLNLAGVNVLRIFPGTAQVVVWGARTTVDPNDTDWVYVNIRRLMLYIEESIAEGIRWAVFEPNNLSLWNKVKRTIVEFLTRVWHSGALFGPSADKAFYVRIDDALNTPQTQALGQLHIEIGVRPSYTAEFIHVRIGLWAGGAEISES